MDLKITSICRSLNDENNSEFFEKKSEKSDVLGIYPNPAKIGEAIVVTVDKTNTFTLMMEVVFFQFQMLLQTILIFQLGLAMK